MGAQKAASRARCVTQSVPPAPLPQRCLTLDAGPAAATGHGHLAATSTANVASLLPGALQDALWRQQSHRTLPALMGATDMLVWAGALRGHLVLSVTHVAGTTQLALLPGPHIMGTGKAVIRALTPEPRHQCPALPHFATPPPPPPRQVCGEDLGMIPACVHPVMAELGLIGALILLLSAKSSNVKMLKLPVVAARCGRAWLRTMLSLHTRE